MKSKADKEKNEYRGAWKLRRCRNCKLAYQPKARDCATAKRSIYCCRKCKDHYRNRGGLDFPRLVEQAGNAIVKKLLTDEKFLDTLRDKLRVRA